MKIKREYKKYIISIVNETIGGIKEVNYVKLSGIDGYEDDWTPKISYLFTYSIENAEILCAQTQNKYISELYELLKKDFNHPFFKVKLIEVEKQDENK